MLTAEIIDTDSFKDTVAVTDSAFGPLAIFEVSNTDTSAKAFEAGLVESGFKPVAFDGAKWTVEKV